MSKHDDHLGAVEAIPDTRCRCICHRVPGVMHCFPCCSPGQAFDATVTFEASPKVVIEETRLRIVESEGGGH